MFLSSNSLDFSLFGREVSIQYYALTMIGGAFLCYLIIRWIIQKRYGKGNLIDNMFVPCFVSGVIGGRIWFVLSELEFYSEYPSEIYKIWHGGLAIQGGVLLGAIVGILMVLYDYKKSNENSGKFAYVLKFADVILPCVLIAQCIGRWGNFFNVEVYGRCVEKSSLWFLPSFILKRLIYDNDGYLLCGIKSRAVQPLFLYEGILTFIGFILLVVVLPKIWKKTRKTGTLAFMYPLYYGLVRIVLEPLRDEEYIMRWGKVSQSVVTSAIYIAIGITGLIYIYLPEIKKLFNKKAKEGSKDE